MACQFLRVTIVAAVFAIYLGDAACVRAQNAPAGGPIGFGGLGRWDAAPPQAETLPTGEARPRRWTLYFPPDWRHPAIIRPPVKVYLDPPYGWEDPFGRFPSPQPVENSDRPAPAGPVVTALAPPPRETPKPKVLELNPSTGQLEERRLGTSEGQPGVPADEQPSPSSEDALPKSQSPFQGLRRWDELSG